MAFKYPGLLNKSLLRKGLESVPSSLLVALVIPFTFFVEGNLVLLRNEVYAILLTALALWYLKRPGLSLIIAIICLFGIAIETEKTIIIHILCQQKLRKKNTGAFMMKKANTKVCLPGYFQPIIKG